MTQANHRSRITPSEADPGYGDQLARNLRLINPDGSYNIEVVGLQNSSFYSVLVGMPWWQFVMTIFILFLLVNTGFACIYYLIGGSSFVGLHSEEGWSAFVELIYFSIQTSTTVGYGHIAPDSHLASIVSSLDAFVGLLIFALYSGLFFARFSMPKVHLRFSKAAVVTDYLQGMRAFKFRIVNGGHNELMNISASVIATWIDESKGQAERKYEVLSLERDSITMFPMNWTIVHPITEDSPFADLDDITAARRKALEIMVHISAYNDMYQNQVHINHSYSCDEIHYDRDFAMMYAQEDDHIRLDLSRLDRLVDTSTGD
ncbi:MAG: ion channel [Bacteroidota bacterium]